MDATRDVYTHGHQDAVLRSHRWRTAANSAAYLLPYIKNQDRILDVGCGPGTLSVDLARHVPDGSLVGVDVAASVIAEATAHAETQDVSNVSFLSGDFRDLDIEPHSFDVVHAHQVLQHLREPVKALEGMAKLVKPGGIIAVRDGDYGAFTWFPEDRGLDRWREIYTSVCRHNGAEPNAGRHLRSWAVSAGLHDCTYSTSNWTFSNGHDLRWWTELWAERCESSTFADQAVSYGIATAEEMTQIAAAWRAWGQGDGGVYVVPHGEVIAHL